MLENPSLKIDGSAESTYSNFNPPLATKSKWEGGQDACQGDSGGPLVANMPGQFQMLRYSDIQRHLPNQMEDEENATGLAIGAFAAISLMALTLWINIILVYATRNLTN